MSNRQAPDYRRAEGSVRRDFAGDRDRAAVYYRGFLDFVTNAAPPGLFPRLIELGCGAGWSTALLAERGYQSMGGDLDPRAFEPVGGIDQPGFVAASVTAIPLADGAVDVVVSYQMLEHVAAPRVALDEMCRVVRPGGRVIVAGPNLISLLNSVRHFPAMLHGNRPWRRLWRWEPGMPRYPFGATLPGAVLAMLANVWRLPAKSLSIQPRFLMREPDAVPPFRGDNDACYLMNPIDLDKYFRRRGWRIVRNGAYGRPRWTAPLAGGTWIAAERPGE